MIEIKTTTDPFLGKVMKAWEIFDKESLEFNNNKDLLFYSKELDTFKIVNSGGTDHLSDRYFKKHLVFYKNIEELNNSMEKDFENSINVLLSDDFANISKLYFSRLIDSESLSAEEKFKAYMSSIFTEHLKLLSYLNGNSAADLITTEEDVEFALKRVDELVASGELTENNGTNVSRKLILIKSSIKK